MPKKPGRRKRPGRHTVHTRDPRYNVSNYPRGEGDLLTHESNTSVPVGSESSQRREAFQNKQDKRRARAKKVSKGKVKTLKGTSYFPSFETARAYALLNGLPSDRIIEYKKGWAIQREVSGPYYDVKQKGWGDSKGSSVGPVDKLTSIKKAEKEMTPMGLYGFYLGVLGGTNDPEIRGYVEPKYNAILAVDRKYSLLHQGDRVAAAKAPDLLDYKIVGAKIHALYVRDTWYRNEEGFIPIYEHKVFDMKKKVANPGQIHLARAAVAPYSDEISEETAKARFKKRLKGENIYDFEYEPEAGRWRVK